MKRGAKGKTLSLPGRRRRAGDKFLSSSLYTASLGRHIPKGLDFQPRDPWPGDGGKADALFRGSFDFAGENEHLASAEPWFAPDMSLHWHQNLHGFGWIRDFSDNGSDAGCRHAVALIASWLKYFSRPTPTIWDRQCLQLRVHSWLCHSDFLIGTREDGFRSLFLQSLRQQCGHLFRLYKFGGVRTRSDLTLLTTLIYASLCFKQFKRRLEPLLQRLDRILPQVILKDGCHISRNPETHLDILASLIGLRDNLGRAGISPPDSLSRALDRLTPMIAFFQHGDGGLGLFNGGHESNREICRYFSKKSPGANAAIVSCQAGGFEKMTAGKSRLIIDSNSQHPLKIGPRHRGGASFEFSWNTTRLVVNCGADNDAESPWQSALQKTAAHSALAFGGADAKSGASLVHRSEQDGHCLIEIENAGYKDLKLGHRRQLYLAPDGLSLKGEDHLRAMAEDMAPGPFALRFHMHPTSRLSLSGTGNSALIQPPKGRGWRFNCNLADIRIEDSVYFGTPGVKRRTRQIVLMGRISADKDITVKWAFSQI